MGILESEEIDGFPNWNDESVEFLLPGGRKMPLQGRIAVRRQKDALAGEVAELSEATPVYLLTYRFRCRGRYRDLAHSIRVRLLEELPAGEAAVEIPGDGPQDPQKE